MEVIVFENEQQIAESAANMVCELVARKPDAVLGLATGNTPLALYRQLVSRYRARDLSFSQVTSFNLDEYLGLPCGHPQSYRRYMCEHLFDHVDIAPGNTYFPECPEGQDPRKVGAVYEASIAAHGGIDFQVLGIGGNGHIGFNEPSSSLASRTRVKTLARRTVDDNSRLFEPDDYQPHLAITMGIGTILDARRVLLIATGEGKGAAVKNMIEGPVSAMCPASVLQQHPRVRVLLDEAAATQLELLDYYSWVTVESRELAAAQQSPELSDPWFYDLKTP